jgi:hypothetical protein
MRLAAKCFIGWTAGTSLVFAGLPESSWNYLHNSTVLPLRHGFNYLKSSYDYFRPSEVQRRQAKLNRDMKNEAKLRKITDSIPETRKKAAFLQEVRTKLKTAQLIATQRSLTREERQSIVYEGLLKYYPELLPEGVAHVKQQLERGEKVEA